MFDVLHCAVLYHNLLEVPDSYASCCRDCQNRSCGDATQIRARSDTHGQGEDSHKHPFKT